MLLFLSHDATISITKVGDLNESWERFMVLEEEKTKGYSDWVIAFSRRRRICERKGEIKEKMSERKKVSTKRLLWEQEYMRRLMRPTENEIGGIIAFFF